jgi:hypothetical protein
MNPVRNLTPYSFNITSHPIPSTQPHTLFLQHNLTPYSFNTTSHPIPSTQPHILFLQHNLTPYSSNTTSHPIPSTQPHTLFLQHNLTSYSFNTTSHPIPSTFFLALSFSLGQDILSGFLRLKFRVYLDWFYCKPHTCTLTSYWEGHLLSTPI